ncbi:MULTISPECIES: glycoside hydrolase family 43 protein [Sphingobacterium]|uniref:Glycoside hydrolase family 43 protein n=1 Tax=Sphingobacterium populi TaxID=1812824 RepID=A0ABW5UHA3_9SPHI|nr:glycoside hydrolase family 43 protein [Sphingobacterium sp. CFCC 11742]
MRSIIIIKQLVFVFAEKQLMKHKKPTTASSSLQYIVPILHAMKKNILLHIFLFLLSLCCFMQQVNAQNPIVQTSYTADPAPLVYNDKVYLYTGQDEDQSTWFVMNDWRVYSSDDMVNWTDHGVVISASTFEWAKGDAWASQCVERNGKFYFYSTVTSRYNGKPAIGVAVADSPIGPFYDALGKPLAQTGKGDIDPTVFIDDDGQAYLYWGNPFLYYAKLHEDMISLKGEIVKVPMTEAAFGKREGNVSERPTLYEEGPWLYKRADLYYLLWAGGPIPEHIGYSVSKSPSGPWEYKGTLMPTEGASFTNHPGLMDYRGKSYFFYHNGALPGGSGFNRSVAVQMASFDPSGAIRPMKMTAAPDQPLQPLMPYQKVEAETMAWSEGMKANQNRQVGVFLTAQKDGAYTVVKGVDFGEDGASRLVARIGTTHFSDVALEIRIGSLNGTSLGKVKVPLTGGNDRWELVSIDIPKTTGVQDVYFVFHGKDRANAAYFDYWKLEK